MRAIVNSYESYPRKSIILASTWQDHSIQRSLHFHSNSSVLTDANKWAWPMYVPYLENLNNTHCTCPVRIYRTLKAGSDMHLDHQSIRSKLVLEFIVDSINKIIALNPNKVVSPFTSRCTQTHAQWSPWQIFVSIWSQGLRQ